jgi:acyl-CoA thioester hydrolase
MSRVELIFPEPIVFSEKIVLRNTDMSRAGHLGFDSLVSIVHRVLNRFFDQRGLPIGEGGGVSYIVKDLAVIYQGEAHVGDVVSVNVGLGEGGEKWVELYFRVLRAEACQKGAERPFGQANLALAKLAVLCFDYDKGATVAFPAGVRKALANVKI